MGVCELSPSNEYFQEILNPINLNLDSNETTHTKQKFNSLKNNKYNNNEQITKNKNNTINIYSNLIKENKNKHKEKKIPMHKTGIINPNKLSNYIFTSKTNYSNYKRVPHLKSEAKDKNSILLTNQTNQINQNNNINDQLWFKTQYKNFKELKDVSNFTISEYNKKKYNNFTSKNDGDGGTNNFNNNNNSNSNISVNSNKYKNNNNSYVNLGYRNNSQTNFKKINMNNMVYTKALPIDYNNEKKIENLFVINKNNYGGGNLVENNLLYIIEKNNYLLMDNSNEFFSTKKDYNNIIKKYSNNKTMLSNYLLELKERNWYKELSDLSDLLLNKRNEKDFLVTNKYIRKTIKLYEHFKWIIESLGIYFNNIIFGKENNNNINNNNNDFGVKNLPEKDRMAWFNGFKWKGIYIKVVTNERSKIIKNEIKALNYFYFDYLQLLDQYPYLQINQLLYLMIFPLISYTEINGFILYGSALINIDGISDNINNFNSIVNTISLSDIIKNNNGVISLYSDCNDKIYSFNSFIKKDNNSCEYCLEALENKYYIKDLICSKLFSQLNIFHFIRINKNKFLVFNLSEFVPKLFEVKNNNDDLKINYLSVINDKRVYYNTKSKLNNNIKIKENIKSNSIKINSFSNPKDVLKNIYNINPYISNLKTKDIIINNIYFRIIYAAQSIKEDNYKNKQFVDYLFNYNDNIRNNNSEIYIVEPYVIIYDLVDSFKLKYSLIKQFYIDENKIKNCKINVLNNLYYLSTDYISYFNAWCEMMNKNSYNIKNYADLKENMKKYGICSQLKFFALVNINNNEILDIIKVSLLVKAIKFIFNKKDNDMILYKLSNISINNNNDINKLLEYRKTKILYIIKCILYPNEILNQIKHFFNNLYEELVFYVNVIFLKLKLIDGYLSLGLLNITKNNNMNINLISKEICGFESPKHFLKHIIKIARDKPFLFLTEMEHKLNFIVDPFVKFKSSISLESMYNKLELKSITLNENSKTHTYIKSEEISGLMLAKILYLDENPLTGNKDNINNCNINCPNKTSNFDCKIKEDNNMDLYSNSNLALRPSYMKTKINLKNYNKEPSIYCNSNSNSNINDNNNLKRNMSDKDTSSLHSSIFTSELDTNKTKNTNDTILNHVKSGKTTSEFYLSISEINKDKDNIQNNENIQRMKMLQKEIYENFALNLPSICYKMRYSYENYQQNSSNNKIFVKFLKNIYFFPQIKTIETWHNAVNKIFNGISSSNGDIEHCIFITLVYLFVITLFFEKKFKEANQINMKIKDIFKKGNFQLSLSDLALINLFQALSSENYIQSEAPYSKSLILLLMNFGEPRGRNNDSHGMLQFPIWKIARKTFKLEQKVVNDYFKEMFQSLSFFEKKKCYLNLYNTKIIFNYSNNVYNNNDNIQILNEISKEMNYSDVHSISYESRLSDYLNNNISENPGFDFFGKLSKLANNLDITLNKNIFNDNILNKLIVKYFKYPSISYKSENLDKIFFKNDFIIYILKEIQSLFMGKKIIYNEEYINEHISNEIFNPYPYNYKYQITYNNDSDSNDNYSESSKKSQTNTNTNIKFKVVCSNQDNSDKNNCYVFPNLSNVNYVYNYMDEKVSKTVKNNKNIKESVSAIKEKKRISMINYSNANIKEKKPKNKNNSVENTKKTNKSNLFSHFLYNELLQKLSYRLNIQSGIVISFGNNTHIETSHENYEKITLPRIIFKLKNVRIDQIFSGWEHNILLTNKGEIYTFGNNQYYQCGLKNKDETYKIIKDPTNISVLNNNIRAKNAACGNEHSLILSCDNNLYAFGNNEDGLLGLNDCKIKRYEFTKINFGKYNNRIKDISAGTVHNLALTDDNKIFSWGSSQGGQLGLSEKYLLSQPGYKTTFFLANPTLVPILNNKKENEDEIIKIGCGEAHSLALNTKGHVYSWGFGSNGQLGLGFCEDSFEPGTGLTKSRRFTPEIIDYLENEKIIDIKCGKTFSMFINDKNELYACGVNDLNQLGLNETFSKEHLNNKELSCFDFVYPTKVDCFLNMKVLKISCGEGHCLAIIKDLISNIQTIWSLGNNKFGQLGQGSLIKKSTPNPINYLSDYNSKRFEEISCGGFHSLCLIKYVENLNWIEDDYDKIINIIDEIGII